ncbi:MAG: helix-turn-helix domain-containing protein [Solidesulfovibrio sp.]|uniref:helix-turn-helix domain-containing protein n=1 Tax=Solidesulfovibrio sp. TaxID=2910990 RepID=UPI00315926A7
MMTTQQAAGVLGIRPETVRQQIRAGRIKATKLGRDWFIEPGELERYHREHQQTGLTTRWKEAKAKQTTE